MKFTVKIFFVYSVLLRHNWRKWWLASSFLTSISLFFLWAIWYIVYIIFFAIPISSVNFTHIYINLTMQAEIDWVMLAALQWRISSLVIFFHVLLRKKAKMERKNEKNMQTFSSLVPFFVRACLSLSLSLSLLFHFMISDQSVLSHFVTCLLL
jgi:hypothetical protein